MSEREGECEREDMRMVSYRYRSGRVWYECEQRNKEREKGRDDDEEER